MSDGNWKLRPVTIVVAVIAVMLLAAREQGVVPASELVVTPGPSEVTYQEAKPNSDYTSDDPDLRAQESMAAAAWVASFVSLFALAGLALTVHFAREAWKAATRSADADNEALELTRTQLSEARAAAEEQSARMERQVGAMRDAARANSHVASETARIGEAQVRAYLSCVGGEFCASEDRLVVRPEFRNVGQSPAQNIRILKLGLIQRDPDSPDIEPNLISDLWFKTSLHEDIFIDDIAPGAADNGCTEYEITKSMLQTPALVWGPIGDILWCVEGEIEWYDVFEKRQTLPFTLFFDDETTDTDWFCGKLNTRD